MSHRIEPTMSDTTVQSTQSVMTEVASRLLQTEQHAATILSDLERQKSVRDSLEVAGKGIQEANTAITELARETKHATEAFLDAVSALREAVGILDPAALKSSIDAIDQRTDRMEIESRARSDQVDAELKQLHEAVQAGMDRMKIESRARSDQIDADFKQVREAMRAGMDQVIERLTPRTIWEGMFGRRKE